MNGGSEITEITIFIFVLIFMYLDNFIDAINVLSYRLLNIEYLNGK